MSLREVHPMNETVYAVDRAGRRRILGAADFLEDGESLRVGMLVMDSGTPPQSPEQAAHAAYEASCRQLDYRTRQSPDAPQLSSEEAYAAMVQQMDYRSRSQS